MSALYRSIATGLTPALRLWLRYRADHGKEDPARLAERYGIASEARPAGRLIWIHGASVGEARSALPLLRAILEHHPLAQVLVTTGTLTSAEMLRGALPARARHQFVPLDVPDWVERFLQHWRPDAALWLESELWPTMLRNLAQRGTPSALVNARMSPRSFASWQRVAPIMRPPVDAFTLVLAQSDADGARLAALGARAVRSVGNLKFDAPQLPADIEMLAALGATIGERPVWLAASTHPGEEEIVADAHAHLARALPTLLTIIVPRHAVRGTEIATALRARGLTLAQRSAGDAIAADTAIYLADTMGELGLFYRLASIAFVGKSLAGEGGQNPLEAAALDTAILTGKRIGNFTEIFAALDAAGALRTVNDATELGDALGALFADPMLRQRMAQGAADVAASGRGALTRVIAALSPVLAALEPGDVHART